jgi:HK97 family phage major capsid protein
LLSPSDLAVERAQLDIKYETGKLSDLERWRRLQLKNVDPPRERSLGVRAATSWNFKSLAAKGLNETTRLTEDVSLVQLDSGAQVKALITATSDTSAGAFITNESGQYTPQPQRRLRILDLVRLGETSVDAVEFARQTTFTNTAAEVAEATSTVTGTKPEATVAFEKVTAPVKDYATWAPATRRALTDATGMRDVIDTTLTFAVRRVLEEAVVTAMVTDAGATQAKGADALPVAVLKLLTTLRNADVEPTAALLAPVDYETLRTLSGTSPYLSGPPITVDSDGTERLFAIPLIVSPSVPDDTALIADMGAVSVWLRDMQIYVSQSHSTYFTSNLAAILAELRAALAVTATASVGKITGWD